MLIRLTPLGLDSVDGFSVQVVPKDRVDEQCLEPPVGIRRSN